MRGAMRHEIDQRHLAFGRGEGRFQDQGRAAVLSAHRDLAIGGCNDPPPVLRSAKQRREAGRAVEARPAQPVDAPTPADEGGGVAVANQRIVIDRRLYVGGPQCQAVTAEIGTEAPVGPPAAQESVSPRKSLMAGTSQAAITLSMARIQGWQPKRAGSEETG